MIYLVHARDLPTVDGSKLDPLFKFKLGDKKVSTEAVKNKTIVEYKKELRIPVDFENPSELPPLIIKAYDYELIGSNKLYATKSLDISSILKNKQAYAFNEVVQLEGEESLKNKHREFGFVYL